MTTRGKRPLLVWWGKVFRCGASTFKTTSSGPGWWLNNPSEHLQNMIGKESPLLWSSSPWQPPYLKTGVMHFQAKSPLKPAGNRRPAGPVAMAMDSDSMTRLSLLKSLSTWQFVSMRAHNNTIWYIKYSSLSLSCFRFVPNYLYCIIHTCIHTHIYIRITTLTKLYIYTLYVYILHERYMYYTMSVCVSSSVPKSLFISVQRILP
jgi:hypothetical protein